MATCSNPGCDQPGTNKCSACKTTPYCGPICQTAHWAHHKEECPGHLRKVGMAHLEKARGFHREQNWPQTLRHADLAATKLKQLKDRPVEDIDEALATKYCALGCVGRHRGGFGMCQGAILPISHEAYTSACHRGFFRSDSELFI